jgi:toxin ParE1/3/4
VNHSFHPEALAEYEAAALYYAERDSAVAERFVAVVDDAIKRILESPTGWRVLDGDVRRCLMQIFPYGVLYTIEVEEVLIVAVMHCSRQPGYWKRRVPVA